MDGGLEIPDNKNSSGLKMRLDDCLLSDGKALIGGLAIISQQVDRKR